MVIPSLGRVGQLKDCIRGVLSQDSDYQVEIIAVIDDLDDEGSADVIKTEFTNGERLILDLSRERRGSAAAKNIGARLAKGEFIVFLDDDTVPTSSWLRHLVESYSAGVVGVGGSERKTGRHSPLAKFLYSMFANRTGKILRSGLVISNFSPYKDSIESVDCLQGCNMSFRREEFLQSGGFDENYIGTAYREETDLCLRLKLRGDLLFVPEAIVDHREEPYGGNSPSSFKDWNYWYHRNNTYFFLKNFRPVTRRLWIRHFSIEVITSMLRMIASQDLSPIMTLRVGVLDGKKTYLESRGRGTDV